MNHHIDPNDAHVDRNLKLLGSRLSIPADPSADQQADWKQPLRLRGPTNETSNDEGKRRMRNRMILMIAGAGTALAASAATLALFILPSTTPTVQASTIFAGLRTALSNAFDVTFENIGDEGYVADGRIIVVYGDRIKGEGGELVTPVEGIYAEAAVHPAVAEAKDDLDLRFNVAISLDNAWAYIHTYSLPREWSSENPLGAVFYSMTYNGLMVDLAALIEAAHDEDGTQFSALGGLIHGEASPLQQQGADDADAEATQQGGRVELGLSTTTESEEAAEPEHFNSNHGFTLRVADVDLDWDGNIGDIIDRLIKGEATQEDIDQLVLLVEKGASDVVVNRLDNETYELVASGLDSDDDLADAILRITYRQGEGVTSAAMENIGAYRGTLRFNTASVGLDDPLFDRTRLIKEGVTVKWDAGAFIDFLKAHH